MARISIDPTEVKKHPKFHAFRKKLDWQPHHAFGFLCAFWGEVANTEANESGDISDWTPEYLADRIVTNNVDPNRLWEALVPGYIEVRPNDRFFVRDWLEIFGPTLRQKYHNTDRQKLIDVWSAFGRIYGRESKHSKPESDVQVRGSESTSFSIEKETSAIDAENSGISASASTQPPKRHVSKDQEGSSVFSPSWETEGEKTAAIEKSPLGFVASSEPEKEPAAVTVLQGMFTKGLAGVLREQPAQFNYGAAGKGFKKLLTDGWMIQDIETRFESWFKSTDSFIVKRSYRVEDFFTYFNRLKDGPVANQVGTNGRKPYYDGFATAGTEREFKD